MNTRGGSVGGGRPMVVRTRAASLAMLLALLFQLVAQAAPAAASVAPGAPISRGRPSTPDRPGWVAPVRRRARRAHRSRTTPGRSRSLMTGSGEHRRSSRTTMSSSTAPVADGDLDVPDHVAASTGTLTLHWEYVGFHAWCRGYRSNLHAHGWSGGASTITDAVARGPANNCTATRLRTGRLRHGDGHRQAASPGGQAYRLHDRRAPTATSANGILRGTLTVTPGPTWYVRPDASGKRWRDLCRPRLQRDPGRGRCLGARTRRSTSARRPTTSAASRRRQHAALVRGRRRGDHDPRRRRMTTQLLSAPAQDHLGPRSDVQPRAQRGLRWCASTPAA